MNLDAVLRIGWSRIPPRLKTRVDFRDPASGTTASQVEAVIVPASGSPSDGFEARATVRDKARRLVVRAVDLAGFEPASNHDVTWGGTTYVVLAATPVPETAPIFWRLTAQR